MTILHKNTESTMHYDKLEYTGEHDTWVCPDQCVHFFYVRSHLKEPRNGHTKFPTNFEFLKLRIA